jgi:hypothetical protein
MSKTIKTDSTPWLLLVFTLPANKASARVGIWRKLQRYGALALRNSGYLLPNTPTNHERFAWLATSIRGSKGQASVLQVRSLDDPPIERIRNLFREERRPDYNALIQEVHKLDRSARGFPNQLARIKRRYDEISEIDFFDCPLRSTAEAALHKAEHPATRHVQVTRKKLSKMAYQKRAWITGP